MRQLLPLGLVLVPAAVLAACGGAPPASDAPLVAEADGPTSCELSAKGSALRPVGGADASSTVALARHGDRTVALVADEDARAVVMIDVDDGTELSKTPLASRPGQLMVLADGRVVVTLRDASVVETFEAPADVHAPLQRRCDTPVPAEPIAMAITPDDERIVLTSGWGRAVTLLDAKTVSLQRTMPVGREPRGVVVTDDGKQAYVAHAVGSDISVIDLEQNVQSRAVRMIVTAEGEVDSVPGGGLGRFLGVRHDDVVPGRFGTRAGCQGYALAKSEDPRGRILAPQVLVDPGDPEGQPGGYGGGHLPTEMPSVAVIDEATAEVLSASVMVEGNPGLHMAPMAAMDLTDQPVQQECLLPRAAAVDSQTRTLLVACQGIDAVVAYSTGSAAPATLEKARFTVGSGPSGIAVDGANRRAVVWSQFDRSLAVISLQNDALPHALPMASRDTVRRIALADTPELPPLEFRLGRELFHAVGDMRISKDGRACASCHPDGRDDAITWATPDGPRRTKMLAGQLHGTAPYAWNGSNDDVGEHVDHTFERLSGQGLNGIEHRALLTYLDALPAPPPAAVLEPQLVAQGKEIFFSERAECSSCHIEGSEIDGRNHEVGSRAPADASDAFNTPSLRYLSGRGPYFHDGRYASLRELLVESDGEMGHTAHLSVDELRALEAFLLTL